MKDMKTRIEFVGSSDNRLAADEHQPRGQIHGNPVVLLHGGGQTRHAWGAAARRIADAGHAAFTIDQRVMATAPGLTTVLTRLTITRQMRSRSVGRSQSGSASRQCWWALRLAGFRA
jgi:pimeloyl-ACP methyl ester carboxylesterase